MSLDVHGNLGDAAALSRCKQLYDTIASLRQKFGEDI